MKAKVTGKSAWQKAPLSATLDIKVHRRYADSSGNATVSHYSGVLNATKDGFVNAFDNSDLWIVVQGPDDPPAVTATFYEVATHDGGRVVRTEWTRLLISDDLNGLIFDYAAADPSTLPAGFGDAPLTMRAASEVLAQKPVIDQALADIAQSEAQRLVRQDTNDLLAQQAIVAAKAQADATAERADTAMADALVMAGVNSAYLSYDGMALPAGAPENSIGAVWDNLGTVQRQVKKAAGWINLGAPVLTAEGLRKRVGLNLRDYAQYVVDGDWTPAWNMLMTVALPGDNITIPPGEYLAKSTWLLDKPVVLRSGGARLLVDHTGTAFRAKPANGSFGLQRAPTGVITNIIHDAQIPALIRQRSMSATTFDGSIGLELWNSVYCTYRLQEIVGFDVGEIQIAKRIGTEYGSMVSYCVIYRTLMRNGVNTVYQCNKDTATATQSNGYISDNLEIGGSYGSFFINTLADVGQARQSIGVHAFVADTATGRHWMNYAHMIVQGTDRGDMCQRFIQNKITFENSHKYGLVAVDGKILAIVQNQPRYEMPAAIAKLRFGADTANCTIQDTYGFGVGYNTAEIDDLGARNRILLTTQWGRYEYQDRHWTVERGASLHMPVAGQIRNWGVRQRRTPPSPANIIYDGSGPITIDLSIEKSWFVDVRANIPDGAITITNPPDNGRIEKFWLTFFQRGGIWVISPRAVAGLITPLNIRAEFSGRDVIELETDNVAGSYIHTIARASRIAGTQHAGMTGTTQPATGTWLAGDMVRNTSAVNPGDPLGWVCTAGGSPGTWLAAGRLQPQELLAAGNNNATHQSLTLQRTFLYDAPLTGSRTVRLYNATAAGAGTALPAGAIVRIVAAVAIGSTYTLKITDNAGADLHTIAPGTWREYQFDGTLWRTIGSGTV